MTGQVLRFIKLDDALFGEGICVYNNQTRNKNVIVMLTWKAKRGYFYDADTFENRGQFNFSTTTGEGWGITFDPVEHLFIVSDGSAFLHFLDPHSKPAMQTIKRVEVRDYNGKPIRHLNELEFVNGHVLANVWYKVGENCTRKHFDLFAKCFCSFF